MKKTKSGGLADSPFFKPTSVSMIEKTQVPDGRYKGDVGDLRPPRTDETKVTLVISVPPKKPERGKLKRNPFDVYPDQLESLHRLKAQSVLAGKEIGISEIVRRAIDRYLEQESMK